MKKNITGLGKLESQRGEKSAQDEGFCAYFLWHSTEKSIIEVRCKSHVPRRFKVKTNVWAFLCLYIKTLIESTQRENQYVRYNYPYLSISRSAKQIELTCVKNSCNCVLRNTELIIDHCGKGNLDHMARLKLSHLKAQRIYDSV